MYNNLLGYLRNARLRNLYFSTVFVDNYRDITFLWKFGLVALVLRENSNTLLYMKLYMDKEFIAWYCLNYLVCLKNEDKIKIIYNSSVEVSCVIF